MKNLNDNYKLHYLKSNLSSNEVALKLETSKKYANKLMEKYDKEGACCLIHKNKGKIKNGKHLLISKIRLSPFTKKNMKTLISLIFKNILKRVKKL